MSADGAAVETLFEGGVRGTVSRVLFENRDSGWTVFLLRTDGGETITVVGTLAPVFPGEQLEVEGRWESDRRYGRQFRGRTAMQVLPDNEEGVRRYLASGVLPGVGVELARRLVERFGKDTLRVLDEEPRRLLAVRGIGPKKLREIEAAWVSRSAERQARIFLQGHGLGPALAERILRAWGEETVARVRREPYALIREVAGVGFRTADAVALRLGLEPDAPERIEAATLHELRAAAESGDCYLAREDLVERARRLLGLQEQEPVQEALARLARGRMVVCEGGDEAPRVYLAWLHAAEERVARRLRALAGGAAPAPAQLEPLRRLLADVERGRGVQLSGAQRSAIIGALARQLVVVTGGPGTGKTTLIDALARCAEALGWRLALAAPTGRAAKRLEQATARPARTLHRLLEFRYDTGFERGPERPIEADLVVVDEVSMVDLPLMDALLAALPEGAHLALVGDADQLPPVGPGAVLRDVIASGVVPVVHLREIYRQAAESLIVANAHRVNAGQMPHAPPAAAVEGPADAVATADFYLIEEGDPDRAVDLVRRLVAERIPARFGLDPMRDVQVLAPMHRGRAGVARLNAALQAALNPAPAGAAEPERAALRPGDRVMQLRNDYDREVFNGDIGHVVEVAAGGDELTVEFDGRLVGYDRASRNDLTLAYAISVHKSQGNEYPAVVTLLLPEHYIMLQRNLLYTALTRARRLAVLVTTEAALRRAVRNDRPTARNTGLAERLRGRDAGGGSR